MCEHKNYLQGSTTFAWSGSYNIVLVETFIFHWITIFV